MQAVYFPEEMLQVDAGDRLQVTCNHDEYSLWFDVAKSKTIPPGVAEQEDLVKLGNDERSLGVTLVSRNRLGQVNDIDRNRMLIRLLEKVSLVLSNIIDTVCLSRNG